MIILIYIAYYFFSILPIITYRFRKYTISDYHYNKRLKWQRRIMLVFNYVASVAQIIIACELERIVRSNQDYGPLLLSACIFLIIYPFPISWLESPKEYKKKKKWK
ncbi:hypothetical protein [Gilliamella sp. B2838]|uniref:hypothetical protein n=2 Tax=unclassified Gilliamella TaxID=2685620 RepID=UPI00226AA46A|nr:hypothetical protein [Gilliamella sp. B2838]MCX8728504.1 hypothetical protein [Gilliamella sp. B2838]